MAQQIQRVKRVALTGEAMTVTFSGSFSGQYLVKNFSQGDIYVSFGLPIDTQTSIKIPTMCGQRCVINENGGANGQVKVNSIYIQGSGEVEVQQLWF